MSTPPSFMQGLLQSLQPWMTGANPSSLDNATSQYGGTQGLLEAMMQGAGPDTTQARQGAALQRARALALDEAASRQQLAQGAISAQLMQSKLPAMQAYYRMLNGMLGGAPAGAPSGMPGGTPGATVSGGATPTPSAPAPSAAPPATASGSSGTGSPTPLFDATSQTAPAGARPPASSASPRAGGFFSNPMNVMRFGALGGALGLPGGQQFFDYGKTALQYDPATATQMALAKSPLIQDRALIAQAQASGSPLALKAAQMKYLKDAGMVNVAAYNGAVTTLGGLTPAQVGASTLNPVQGIQTTNGVETPIPGAPQTQQALAAAKGLGGAAGRTVNVGGIPVPALDVLGRGGAASQTIKPAASATTATAGSKEAPQSFADLLREGEYQKQLGEEGGKQVMGYQEAADAARNANYALDQMIQDGQKVSLGPAAGAKEWGLKVAAGLGQMVGMAPPQELSNYQELDKYANQVAFAATRQMGSREAAQIVHLQMQSNPNKELTAPAFMDLAGSMKAMNNYIMAKNVAIQQASQENGGNTALASAKWTQQIDPRVWDLTLSPQMGDKWAAAVGKDKIAAAWPYLTPPEQQALIANIPTAVRAQWLK